MENEKQIEELELKYLNKYYYFLKFTLDEILEGLKTRDKIKNDWEGLYGAKISSFATGAERVIYSLLNGKGIGTPNSAPVGSDLFFEVNDAFIHIDLKTVGATLSPSKEKSNNIGDFSNDIFIGTNQNSYSANIYVHEGMKNQITRPYKAHLPPIYNSADKNKSKPCLTYFITMLYDRDTLETLVINLLCMPNGLLNKIYEHKPIKAGKNFDKARFNFSRTPDFELLNEEKRVKIVFFEENMDQKYLKSLRWQYDLFKSQK
tara:strand:- start:358 stop:1140 length:783 start_codon:yes stop_codon:yes gene_type:complete